MSKRLTNREFIERAEAIHGKKFNYSKAEYQTAKKKVTIICKKHGDFNQEPHSHLAGIGCKSCGMESSKKPMTKQEFIKKARNVHGEKYDYSLVIYVNRETKIKIIDKNNRVLEQTPWSHLKGCDPLVMRSEKVSKTRLARTGNSDIIKVFKSTHGERYDYSPVNYLGAKKNINIICKVHGEFPQTSDSHRLGSGCPDCDSTRKSRGRNFTKKSTTKMLNDLSSTHNGLYKYPPKKMIKVKLGKIKIRCSVHGWFSQLISDHMKGHGCPNCAGKNQKESYLNIVDGIFLKYGISNNSASRLRQQRQRNKLTIKKLGVWVYKSSVKCTQAEKKIKLLIDPVASKYDMPDGYTETAPISSIGKIISIYEAHGGVRI